MRSCQSPSTSPCHTVRLINWAIKIKGSSPRWERPSNVNAGSQKHWADRFKDDLKTLWSTAERWERRPQKRRPLLTSSPPPPPHAVKSQSCCILNKLQLYSCNETTLSFLSSSSSFLSAQGKNCWHKCEGGDEIKRPYFRAAVVPLWLWLWGIKS